MTTHISERLPRYKRAPQDISCALTERDIEILGLTELFRLASSEQLRALAGGSGQGVLRRLQKLFHAGYLDRLQPKTPYASGSSKMVYAITNKGIRKLQEEGRIKQRSTTDWNAQNRSLHDFSIRHTLLVSDIRAALTVACRENTRLKLLFWREGRELYDTVEVMLPEGYAAVPVAPDAYFGLEDSKGRMHFFLEADRGTMTVKRFVRKLKAYAVYHRERRQQEKLGIRYFRVLTVTTSPERAANLAAAANKHEDIRGLARMFLFACDDDVSIGNAGNITRRIWTSLASADCVSILGETESLSGKEADNNGHHKISEPRVLR